MPTNEYVAIPGSVREPMSGASQSGSCNPNEEVQVTVVIRPRSLSKNVKHLAEVIASGERLTRAQYEERYGADAKDVEKIRKFARAHKLTVSGVSLAARTVRLKGTAATCAKAFQVDLNMYAGPQA